jgi:hypothetical protein
MKGEAVVCLTCSNTKCEEINYRPFVKRHGKKGIKTVRWSRGGFLVTGVGGTGQSISYTEFAKGKYPPASKK